MEIRFPIPNMRAVLLTVSVLVVASVGYGFYALAPDRQLDRAQIRLVSAVEGRDWKAVESIMADDYRDAWGFDRAKAIELGSELLRHFFVLGIESEGTTLEITDNSGTVRSVIRLSGNGTAIAQAVLAEANLLEAPFEFTWRRVSWKPWDWRLMSVNQPEVPVARIPPGL